ncbi:alpha/beta hydrolase [Avibacterium paragallinarum]|uniref:Alpha/beta hydrolase n=7 Tax=Avibacterium paragallinarum TaxID=728 RepID=A0ABU7QHZ4_AVIPA|nr:alpha/beta hydrolase [Avibacterium paragallinarum]MEE3608741.1 alpha/beta hydrolase [Avibacterium paragallinarum]MEE3620207.1 alpha/beta hydrolase [Avibacterium paragallinarum]MEE3668109.1 alpha/beta hydrolase [Avibacterium paragallinarum]MEE3681036.1 alpha/beta hydrolase [Avibacterium paragallinarum]MEE4385874.1 alpha/beta hydrolase [Avibacterium paragallinarum]
MKLKPLFTALFLSTTLLGGPAMAEIPLTPMKGVESLNMTQQWDKIFPQSNQVEHHKVRFKNRFGITLVGDLYIPKNAKGKLPAIAVSGPFGAVKEQTSGLYAQTLAERGFVTLAFDPSYTGESGGTPRNMASPDVNTEDFSAALDYLGLQNFVDRNRLGVLGICGLGGMALNDAAMDTRVKAVATSVMYDMSRSIGWGVGDQKNGYTPEQRQIVKTYLNNLRWADAESGERAIGLHEVVLDPNNNVVPIQQGLPDELPANANPVLAQFHNFYKTQRGYHPRSINSTTAWTATMPLSFVNIPMMSYISEISPRPMLIVTGENAHSRYMAEEAYQAAGDNPNKELVIVPNATHVDLYDNQAGKIPFDTFADFFKKHL